MRAGVAALFLWFLVSPPFAAHTFAADSGAAPADIPTNSADLIGIEARLSPGVVPPGGRAEVVLTVTIANGWHVNAHKPSLEYLIPTEVKFEPLRGLAAGAPVYPPSKSLKFAFAEERLDVYEGRIAIRVPVAIARDLPPGDYTLKGTLGFQPCNNEVCIAPGEIPIEARVRVEGAPVEGGGAAPESASATGVPAGPDTSGGALAPLQTFEGERPAGGAAGTGTQALAGNDLARLLTEKGQIALFAAIFVLGLFLNLTPCVYPMLAVTVSIFGAQTEKRTSVVVSRALTYVLGISVMYSTLGVVAASAGGMFGSLLQIPGVLVGIAVILGAMALGMFGVYELTPPPALLNKLGGATTVGYLGIFLSGLLVGIFAAPCIGPPIIALLALVAAKGDRGFGFLAFFVLSLGLGLPYLILGTFSGLLRKLPRSGAWMVWVSKVFGVVLMAVALFYLCLGVFAKGLPFVFPAALILGGLYLGFLDRSAVGKKIFRRVQWAVGAVAIFAGVALAIPRDRPSIVFEAYSDASVRAARDAGKPVMIDFSADWCVPCHELEQITFVHPDVVAAAAPFVALKVDLTKFGSPESEALRRRYAIGGVPTVLFLDAHGNEVREARLVGFLKPESFLGRIRLVTGGS